MRTGKMMMVVVVGLTLGVGGSSAVMADHVEPTIITGDDWLPVNEPGTSYVTLAGHLSTYTNPGGGDFGVGTIITHAYVSTSYAPPAVGITSPCSFDSDLGFLLTLPDGSGPFPIYMPSLAFLVNVTGLTDNGTTRTFSNRLNWIGSSTNGFEVPGTGGARMRIRPTSSGDPDHPWSTGETVITDLGGSYQISSFFDVYTELSLDGGASWIPDNGGTAHLHLTPEPASLSLLALGGLALLRRRR